MHTYPLRDAHTHTHTYMHTYQFTYEHAHFYAYIYTHTFFFIIQRVKARAILCPHQPPTRGDDTVSVAQGGTAIPGTTKQLLLPDRVSRELYIYIYIYIRQIN